MHKTTWLAPRKIWSHRGVIMRHSQHNVSEQNTSQTNSRPERGSISLSGLVEAAIGAPMNPDPEVEISSFGNTDWYLDFTLETEDDGPAGDCGTAVLQC